MGDLPIQRKLAAILYADVAGYSRLTGADEVGAHAALRTGLAMLTKAIESHAGRVNHYAGDAILAEFGSVVDCVTTAVNAQWDLAVENADVPEDKRLEFRIGIHSGEVMIDGTEIYGDDVNIAARLESLADPGGICVSGIVAQQVRHRMDEISFDDMGDQEVKNIAQPIRAYKVVMDRASSVPIEATLVTEMPSIAVLPFDNLSGDTEQEYFSDGITEDIITALSRFSWLFVMARNSSFSYKGQSPDIRDVAKDLGVRYVLEGSVRKASDRVRVSVQLIEGATGKHLWAERYDRDLEDIFTVQDEITATVVGAMAPELAEAEIERSRAKPIDSLDAWDIYQRGMYHAYRQSEDDLRQAEGLFRRAIQLDPKLSAAHSGLSYALFMLIVGRFADDEDRQTEEAVTAGRKAVELDRNDVNAHCALGRALQLVAMNDGNWDEVIATLRHALALSPMSPMAHYQLGRAHAWIGHAEETISHSETMLRLSPRDQFRGPGMLSLATGYFVTGEYEKTLDRDPPYGADADGQPHQPEIG